jgi:hypothetical protein
MALGVFSLGSCPKIAVSLIGPWPVSHESKQLCRIRKLPIPNAKCGIDNLYGVSAGAILGRFSNALPPRYVGTVLMSGCHPEQHDSVQKGACRKFREGGRKYGGNPGASVHESAMQMEKLFLGAGFQVFQLTH